MAADRPEQQVEDLSERQVFRVLQHIAADLGDSAAAPMPQLSTDEMEQVLSVFVQEAEAHGVESEPPTESLPGNDVAAQARALLRVSLGDGEIGGLTRDLVRDPPEETQLGVVSEGLQQAIVLGMLVTWLQTKIGVKFKRAQGKTEVEIEASKIPTDSSTIRKLLGLARSVTPGRGEQ